MNSFLYNNENSFLLTKYQNFDFIKQIYYQYFYKTFRISLQWLSRLSLVLLMRGQLATAINVIPAHILYLFPFSTCTYALFTSSFQSLFKIKLVHIARYAWLYGMSMIWYRSLFRSIEVLQQRLVSPNQELRYALHHPSLGT